MGGSSKDKGGKKGEADGKDAAAAPAKPAAPEKKPLLPIDALHENIQLLEASVANKDQAGIKRVLRKNTFVRKRITLDDFRVVMSVWLPRGSASATRLNKELDVASRAKMQVDGEATNKPASEAKRKDFSKMNPADDVLPEVIAYLSLFVANALLARGCVPEAEASLVAVLDAAQAEEARPTLEIFVARAYFLKARCAELQGRLHEMRGELLAAHRTACLRLHEFLQVTLVNLILRSYCESNLIEQAAKFAAKANFPEHVSNNQQVRYLYYMGRIHAIQLDYSLAYVNLTQALRKAPQNTALGFRIAVHKLASIVQLLMGDMPERSYFSDPELADALLPYFQLCKAVRNGSLAEYDSVCKAHSGVFAKDKVSTLVVRLRNSVIRTGLRRINVSYSRISFKDVAKRLALDSPESAELICAKAVRDGVIDATISHEKGQLVSSEVLDIYSTIEPQQAFHKRIQFCLSMHNDAVKAMRYPPDAHKAKHDLVADEEKKTEEEIAKEIEEELEEDEE